MGDAFSNWINRRVDDVRDISRRIQAGETPIQHSIKDQRQVQQQVQQQMHVDRVELSSKGHLSNGHVDKNHIVFEGTGSHGKSDKHQGGQKNHQGGSEKSHNGSEKSHSEKQIAKTANNGSEKVQAKSEKPTPPAERTTSSNPESHTAKRPGPIAEPVPPANRSVIEPIVTKANMSAQEFLTRVAAAGGFDHVPPGGQRSVQGRAADSHASSMNRGSDHHAARSADGKAQSQYVEPRNVPEHVKKGQKETVKEQAPTKEAPKEQIKKQDAPQRETVKNPEATSKAQQPSEGHHSAKSGNSNSGMDLRSWAGKTVGTGLGFLGIAGGVSETKLGVEQFKSGHKVEGALNITAGASDITSGTASVLYTWGKSAMGTVAAKAGGAGSILSGVSEGIEGIRNKDQEKQVEGGIKVVLGVGMLQTASRVSPLSASAMAGWSGGRFIGSHVGWGGENIDTKVTRYADSKLNQEVNSQLAQIEKTNQQMYAKTQDIQGKELGQIQNEGYTSKDVTEAIIGMREQIEATREAGNSTEAMQQELKRLTEVRGHLSR